ncbi:MAG: leucine-rich repeat domain-containing protein [Myxococcales bacterium]|nr:leucine-rich repeat domain-containing protein [Myxococcales bacterium]
MCDFFPFVSPRLTPPLGSLQLSRQRLIAVSDNIAELTRVTRLSVSSRFSFCFALTPSLQLHNNSFTAIPAGVLAMTQLTSMDVRRHHGRRFPFFSRVAVQLTINRLVAIPPEIGLLTSLTALIVSRSLGHLATPDIFLASSAATRSWPCLVRSDGSQRSSGWW